MKINCTYQKLVPVTQLVRHPQNANVHPEKQIQMLAKILKYQGWRHPIVVSELSGYIVAGHGRLDAALINGWTEVPVDVQKFDDKAQELAFLLSDNLIAELAETDKSKLDEIAIELGDSFDHELLGLEEQIIIPDEDKEAVEDDVPEPTQAISKLGDLYELGEHRLLCGDSTDKATVERLMNGDKADMVFTDPPYGISIVKSGSDVATAKTGFVSPRNAPSPLAKAREYRPIANDDKPFDPLFILNMGAKHTILWGANHYASKLPDRPQWLIWDKKLESGGLDHNNFSDCELAWTNSDLLSAKIYRHTWAGMLRKGNRTEELKDRVHPTQKPVGLCEQILKDYEFNNCLDLFGGSGSTLIACEKTKRKCYMMELDPHYIDVIVSRWCKYTGKYEIKRNGEPMTWPRFEDINPLPKP